MTTKTGGPPVEGLPHLEEIEEPMTDIQSREKRKALGTLLRRFSGSAAYVTEEMPIAYDRRDLRKTVAPDVLVAFDIPPGAREKFLPWREGRPPDWVLEVASATTAERDRAQKPPIYAAIGVRELVLFDPEDMHHPEVLLVYRLAGKSYEAVPPGENGRFPSEILGLELAAVDYREGAARYWTLRFYEPGAAEPIPTEEELIEAKDRLIEDRDRRIEDRDRRIADLEAELRRRETRGARPETAD